MYHLYLYKCIFVSNLVLPILAYLTMLTIMTTKTAPTVPTWERHDGKKHIASMSLNGTLIELYFSSANTNMESSVSSWCPSKLSIANAEFTKKSGIQPIKKNAILIGSAIRQVKILNIPSTVRRDLIIKAISIFAFINQICNYITWRFKMHICDLYPCLKTYNE